MINLLYIIGFALLWFVGVFIYLNVKDKKNVKRSENKELVKPEQIKNKPQKRVVVETNGKDVSDKDLEIITIKLDDIKSGNFKVLTEQNNHAPVILENELVNDIYEIKWS